MAIREGSLSTYHTELVSLNDQVFRNVIDNRPFQKVDDILDLILVIPLLFKIDIVQAFRNLRDDPVDAVKLSITLANKWYMDQVITFARLAVLPLFR